MDPATFGFTSSTTTASSSIRTASASGLAHSPSNANTKNEKLGLTPAQRGARRTKFLLAVSVTEDPRYGWHLYWWDATKDDGAYNYGEDGKGFIFVPGDSGDYPYIGIDNGFFVQTNIVGYRDPTSGATTNRRYAFANIGLDVRDPLRSALDGLFAQPTDVNAYVCTPGGDYVGPSLADRPLHYEIGLV